MIMTLIHHKSFLQKVKRPFIIALLKVKEAHALEIFKGTISPQSKLKSITYLIILLQKNIQHCLPSQGLRFSRTSKLGEQIVDLF